VKSRTTRRFRKCLQDLPSDVKEKVREAYRLFLENPAHPSLRLKKIHPTEHIYSVRITRDYRAVGVREEDEIIWFWIGSHSDYDHLLSRGDRAT